MDGGDYFRTSNAGLIGQRNAFVKGKRMLAAKGQKAPPKKLMHLQKATRTACGKGFGWRTWVTSYIEDVTCRRCLAAVGIGAKR